MKFFEEILKNRLKDATSREGVDADDLWAGIADALPAEKPAGNSRKLWLLLPLLFMGGGALWFYISDIGNDNLQANESNIVVLDDQLSVNKPANTQEDKTTNVDASTAKFTKEEVVNIQRNIDTQTNISQEKTIIKSVEKRNTTIIKTEIVAQNTPTTSTTNNDDKILFTLEDPQENPNNKTNFNADIKSSVTSNLPVKNPLRQNLKDIDLLASKVFYLNSETDLDLSDFILPISSFPASPQKKKMHRFSIGVYSGVNTVQNYFANTIKGDLLQNAYNARLGYTVGTEVAFNLRENLSFSTGFEYSKTITQFNIIQEKDGFTDNPNTTEVDEVRAKIVRTVKHHNRLDFLTVPLMLSISKEYGKFELGIGAGLGLNIITRQWGKSLNAWDNIDDYSFRVSQIPLVPYSNFVSYHLRPFARLKATEKLSLQLRPEFRYISHGTSDFFGLKHSSLMSSINLGISFRL